MDSRDVVRPFGHQITEQITRRLRHVDGTVKVTEVRKRTVDAGTAPTTDKLTFGEAEEACFKGFQKPLALAGLEGESNLSMPRVYNNWTVRVGLILSLLMLLLMAWQAHSPEEVFPPNVEGEVEDTLSGMRKSLDRVSLDRVVHRLEDRIKKLQHLCFENTNAINRVSADLDRRISDLDFELSKTFAGISGGNMSANYESLVKRVGVVEGFLAKTRNEISNLKSTISDRTDGNGKLNTTNGISAEDVKEWIRLAIDTYDADKTNEFDFALESAGAVVLVDRCSRTYSGISSWRTVIPFMRSSHRGPEVVIQRRLGPSTGDCWPFEGGSGILTVKLAEHANITAVSYEHLPASLSIDRSLKSAPKDFQIWGYDDDDEQSTRRMLGEYHYSNEGPALQFFKTQVTLSSIPLRVVELRITSNYGSHYTCLYRFRVHGHQATGGPSH
uniref:Nuclear migration and anchoring protein unc-84 n=1 Tax=Ascaris suum TaxID=6253 RepID=F1KWL9_ASCSU